MKTVDDKIALFDLDGTLADYDSSMETFLKSISETGAIEYDYHSDDTPRWFHNRVKLIRSQPNWWLNLEPLSLGFDILRVAIRIGYRIGVLTKGPNSYAPAWTEKFAWCRNHLPAEADVTITQDKSRVYGRVLVDDYPVYAAEWLEVRPRGFVIMPISLNNAEFQHPRVLKYNGTNLGAVEELLQLAYNRKPYQIINLAKLQYETQDDIRDTA